MHVALKSQVSMPSEHSSISTTIIIDTKLVIVNGSTRDRY